MEIQFRFWKLIIVYPGLPPVVSKTALLWEFLSLPQKKKKIKNCSLNVILHFLIPILPKEIFILDPAQQKQVSQVFLLSS